MLSFKQYITEVATTPHQVGKGNKHGIKKHTYVGAGGDSRDTRHETTYHFPHPDGNQHVSVKFEGHHEGDGQEPSHQELSYGVHDSEPNPRGDAYQAGKMNFKHGKTSAKHAGKIQSKVHSIVKHHMKRTKANTIRWTSEKFRSEEEKHEWKSGKLGTRTKIYQRQVKRSLGDHPDWEYSDNSEDSKSAIDAHTTHLLTRKKK